MIQSRGLETRPSLISSIVLGSSAFGTSAVRQRRAVFQQHLSQTSYHRKNFVVTVCTLAIEGGLLILTDLSIFGEDVVGKPDDEWPEQFEQSGDRRPPD